MEMAPVDGLDSPEYPVHARGGAGIAIDESHKGEAMTTLRRCLDYLDRNRIRYTHTTHANAYQAREVAAAEHMPAHKLAKTVIFCGDGCYAMAVLPADCLIDLEALAARLGLTRVRLATEGELVKLFPDSEVGAMPPFGRLFNLPVYVDDCLTGDNRITFNAGTHRDAIHMSFADFFLLEEPIITPFAHLETSVR
jgi:Ala-tRNA(Pro) deacylase